jgi:biotin operon repressor
VIALVELKLVAFDRLDLEEREDFAVQAARASGASWAQIGAALGMSRQAAWQQFSKRLES